MKREEEIEQQTFVYYETCSDEDIDGDGRTYRLPENWIFPTKEELLKSL